MGKPITEERRIVILESRIRELEDRAVELDTSSQRELREKGREIAKLEAELARTHKAMESALCRSHDPKVEAILIAALGKKP